MSSQKTKLVFLNMGVAEPLDDKLSFDEVLHRGSVLSLEIDGEGQATELVSHEAMPDGIDYADGRIFWTDMGNPSENDGAVYSAKLDGSDLKTLVSSGQVHTPKQLICVDKKLYFCDREGCRVMRVNMDGSELETLVQTKDWQKDQVDVLDWCVGIAVSKKLGKIYWTQKGPSKGEKGRILSASLEAQSSPSGRKDIEVVMDHLPEPIDLELDEESGDPILYWTDRGELPLGNTLNKKTLVGEPPAAEQKRGRQILAQGFAEAIGLNLDRERDCMWVADIGGNIWQCNIHKASRKVRLFESETGAFTGLTIVKT